MTLIFYIQVKIMNVFKEVNYDLFLLHNIWLTTKKIFLNEVEPELINFRSNGIAPTLSTLEI